MASKKKKKAYHRKTKAEQALDAKRRDRDRALMVSANLVQQAHTILGTAMALAGNIAVHQQVSRMQLHRLHTGRLHLKKMIDWFEDTLKGDVHENIAMEDYLKVRDQ